MEVGLCFAVPGKRRWEMAFTDQGDEGSAICIHLIVHQAK